MTMLTLMDTKREKKWKMQITQLLRVRIIPSSDVLSDSQASNVSTPPMEQYLIDRGHQVYFLPDFHWEVNPREHVWAWAKVYCRAYTTVTMTQIVNPALDSVSVGEFRQKGTGL